jgi:hypothetical protein
MHIINLIKSVLFTICDMWIKINQYKNQVEFHLFKMYDLSGPQFIFRQRMLANRLDTFYTMGYRELHLQGKFLSIKHV